MNIALRYFGGNKKYFIPFIVLFAAYALIELYASFDSLILFLGLGSSYPYLIFSMVSNIVSLILISVMWLCADKKIFIAALSLTALSYILHWVMMFTEITLSENYLPQTIAEIAGCAAFLVAVLLLRLKSAGKIKRIAICMVILLILISGVITNVIGGHGIGLKTILLEFLPGLLLIAVLVALWIPLNQFLICPKCGRRNNKTAGFCGGCGSPFK